MLILNTNLFKSTLKRSPYKTIGNLSESLGIHRNTLSYYLSGTPVIPTTLELALKKLKLSPLDALIEISTENESSNLKPIAPLVDKLHEAFPHFTLILFGSRAKGSSQKYSDWDLGIHSREPIAHKDYQKAIRIKSDFEDDSPYFIDLVNLNEADDTFMTNISKNWMFLTGRQTDWIHLNEKYRNK